jgi:hypothetical protein
MIMKKLLLFSMFLILAGSINAQENYDLYLLFGQSNMVGLAQAGKQDTVGNKRVLMLSYNNCGKQKVNTWTIARPPMHCSDWHAGLGLGDWFAKDMADFDTTRTIGIIPCAIGGVDIDYFRKGIVSARRSEFSIPPDNHWTGAYPWMLERCKEAMKKGTIKGILLHQGESDNGSSAWTDKVKGIIADLKADLGLEDVPVFIGELGYYFGGGIHNPIIAKTAQQIPNAYVISAKGLTPQEDNLHLDAQSYRTFGHRYASKLKEIETGIFIDFAVGTADTTIAVDGTIKKFTVEAHSNIADDEISKVEFIDNGKVVFTDTEKPYEWQASLTAVAHKIKAKATTNSGKWNITGVVNVLSNKGIKVTGVSILPGSVSFEQFRTKQLEFAIAPADAEIKTVTWISNKPEVVSISNTGLITAVSAGSATITVTTVEGNKTAKCSVIVTPIGKTSKYEAEDATLTGCTIAKTGNAGFSGIGYVEGMDTQGDELKFKVNATETGKYSLSIRYKNSCDICQKYQDIVVNDTLLAQANFNALKAGWNDLSYGYITLIKGSNTIKIVHSWGWTYFDFITISAVTTGLSQQQNLNEFSVYPNPVKAGEKLNLKINTMRKFSLRIFNDAGIMIRSQLLLPENGEISIDDTIGLKGMYLINIVSDSLNQSIKVVFE